MLSSTTLAIIVVPALNSPSDRQAWQDDVAIQEPTRAQASDGEAPAPGAIAPWGSPPTPLIPRWYRDALSSVSIPATIRRSGFSAQTVGELAHVWQGRSAPVDNATRMALVALVRHRRPPRDYVVVPATFDRAMLEQCPLKFRTRNCLWRTGLLTGEGILTVGRLLSIRSFGVTSLLDLMCIMEALLPSDRAPKPSSIPAEPVAPPPCPAASHEPQTDVWSTASRLLKPLLSAAATFCGANTLGDALRRDLGRLASALGLGPKLEALSLQKLTDGQRTTDELLARLATFQRSTSAVERLVLEERLLSRPGSTLGQLGAQIGVTRERVRQIQHRLTKTIESQVGSQLRVTAALARQQLGPVLASRDLDDWIASLFADSRYPDASALASGLLRSELGYSCENGTCLDGGALSVVKRLRETASSVADDVGLIDETQLRAQLPGEEWQQHCSTLLARCNFHRLAGRLALRDSGRARVKSALLNIGRPATRAEIAKASGVSYNRVSSQLSVIPGVTRADKTHWGLAEWIDDRYEGIPLEIMQRIDEDGGATTLDRLLDELPRLFGVAESSVRAYVGTSQFVLRDNYVSVASASSIPLRDLNDVIHGRDADGAPYWTFPVEDRYLRGYSLPNFPPELARELGCKPNGKTLVPVAQPDGCRELTVIWRLASLGGAYLGYLAEPLQRLAVGAGDRVRLVVKTPASVELHRHLDLQPAATTRGTSANFFLDRIKNRRKVI